MTDKKKKAAEPSYAEANAELETILQEVESGEIDLDVLSDKVERAAALLLLCQRKLAATETKVKKVVADLGAIAASDSDTGTDAHPEEEDQA